MADRAVDLPKPHPDDAEDVVDWLSTARTLWARGERADALVWLRRAAEAAAECGQPFRASEIGMYVTAIEETFGEAPRRTDPAVAKDVPEGGSPGVVVFLRVMYGTVPSVIPVAVNALSWSLAMPKSNTLRTLPSPSRNRLSGLTSRWTTPTE